MSNPFRTVLVGCGSISRAWLQATNTLPQVEYVGLVDLNLAQAEALKSKFPSLANAAIGIDLETMLKQTSPDIVFDCTVPEAHTAVTLTALKHGCHVLGEKPLADTVANASKMLQAAEASGKTYAVIQNRRYLDDIVRFRSLIQSGDIGKLTTLNADFYLGPHFGGFRDEMAHVLLLDMAIHSFDQARFISGADPIAVYCHEWNPAGSWYAHGASAIAIFEMSNGLIFTYRGSWCAEGLNTTWECDWRAVGTSGTAVWDGGANMQAERPISNEGFLREQTAVLPPDIIPLTHTAHAGVIAEFLDSITNGTTSQTICTDNIKSLIMVYAAIHSAQTKQRVVIADFVADDPYLANLFSGSSAL
ncbi:MAG: Gfo/Idh/MocA family oxidoreductase [Chloroflexota bacterium]